MTKMFMKAMMLVYGLIRLTLHLLWKKCSIITGGNKMHPVSKIATYAIVIGNLVFGGDYSCNDEILQEKQDKLREVIISFRHGGKNIQEINQENSDLATILAHDGGRP